MPFVLFFFCSIFSGKSQSEIGVDGFLASSPCRIEVDNSKRAQKFVVKP